MSIHAATYVATYHPPRGDSIERSFPTDSAAVDWLRIQCPGAAFEYDARSERWTAWDARGRLNAEVNRQKAE